ncbi:MAG: nucleotidyltransferase domain-containing protein [Candidatus Hydrogenedentales bacterium]
MLSDLSYDRSTLANFCKKWRVAELALFGSVLRDDFRDDSDVDVLVTLGPDAVLDLFDWMDMRDELQTILGRPVDMVEKSGLRNPYRREEILTTSKTIYAH